MIICENLGTLSLGDQIADIDNQYLNLIAKRKYGRILAAAGFVGSGGAVDDSRIQLTQNLKNLIKLPNPTIDSIITQDVIQGLEGYIPSTAKLEIEAIDAFSNDCYAVLSFLEQRAGESLVGKIQGNEQLLFETLGSFAENKNHIEETTELGNIEIDENNDRFIPWMCLVGGSAVWDSGLKVTVSGDFRGTLRNTALITETYKRNTWLPANIYIPKGEPLGLTGIDAAPAACSIGIKILSLTPSRNAASIESAKPEGV